MPQQRQQEPKESLNKCWKCQEYMRTQTIQQQGHNIKVHYCPKCDVSR